MIRKSFVGIFALALGLGLMVIASNARADELNQSSQLTFNHSVEIPGDIVLPAGSYWFVLPDSSNSASNVVQIWNADQTHLYATLLTVPTTRMETTDPSELTFAKQAKNAPIVLMDWFYPGRLMGHEFVYPSREEARLSEDEQITITAGNAGRLYGG